MRNFCTYFDSNYLPKGLALYQSLVRHSSPFRLWVLCFDDETYDVLRNLGLPEVKLIPLSRLEESDRSLLAVKDTRSKFEYYFTCTPSWPRYILQNYPEVDLITYLDADLYFYSNLAPIFEEMGDTSILIAGHRFSEHLKFLERYGIYNVGFLSFRQDQNSLRCLDWWRERCLEWCYDRVEDDRFADQKYLDDWTERFEGVTVLQHKGTGVAPWNMSGLQISSRDDQIMVGDIPLIYLHFQGLKMVNARITRLGVMPYQLTVTNSMLRLLYRPYIRELRKMAAWARPAGYKQKQHQSRSFAKLTPKTLAKEMLKRELLFSIRPGQY